MALYRDSYGFLCEFASNPGAGYTAISAMPTDTAQNKAAWWRALDIYGQSSDWHPSTGGGTYESPALIELAGSGINICAWRYSVFEESALPPLVATNITPTLVSGGFLSSKYLRLAATAANGTCYLNAGSSAYNIKLTPNKKWVLSVWCAPESSGAKAFNILIKTSTAGAISTLALTTGATAGTYTRASGILDLSADGSPQCVMAAQIVTSGDAIRFDGFMMEEQVGTGTKPSAFFAPTPRIDGSQLDDGSVPSAKVINLTVDKLVGGSITGQTFTLANSASVIKSANYSPGSTGILFRGDGFAELQNVTVRGSLNAGDLVAGFINGSRFGTDTITSGPVISGQMHTIRAGAFEPYSIPMINNTTLSASSFWAGPLSIPSNSNRSAILIWVSFLPLVSAAVAGRLVGGIARGSAGTALAYSTFVEGIPAGQNATLSFVFFDASPGTGSLNYYSGFQHSIQSSGNINARINWATLEISK